MRSLQDNGAVVETVFECSSAAGKIAGVIPGLGVAMSSQWQFQTDTEIVDKDFPRPPDFAYVIRVRACEKSRVRDLVREIGGEVPRFGVSRSEPDTATRLQHKAIFLFKNNDSICL